LQQELWVVAAADVKAQTMAGPQTIADLSEVDAESLRSGGVAQLSLSARDADRRAVRGEVKQPDEAVEDRAVRAQADAGRGRSCQIDVVALRRGGEDENVVPVTDRRLIGMSKQIGDRFGARSGKRIERIVDSRGRDRSCAPCCRPVAGAATGPA